MKKWDVFISHASEDKQAIALPLAESLVRSGLKVWLDRFELRVGHSLREKIDEGLSESAFGVVILSEHFLNNLLSAHLGGSGLSPKAVRGSSPDSPAVPT